MANDLTVIGSNFSQQHQRRYLRAIDQHGRRWGVNIEIRTGAPVGNWDFYFVPPHSMLVPSAQYLRRDDARPNRVWIDYDAIIRDMRQAQKEWDTESQRLMRKRHPQGDIRSLPLDDYVTQQLGHRPGPVEIWVACKQGNRYALGLTAVVDERVAKYLPKDESALGEIDFADDDFADAPATSQEAEQEEEDLREVDAAWNPGDEKKPIAAAQSDFGDLDDIFDPDALGGTRVAPKSPKARSATKGKKVTRKSAEPTGEE